MSPTFFYITFFSLQLSIYFFPFPRQPHFLYLQLACLRQSVFNVSNPFYYIILLSLPLSIYFFPFPLQLPFFYVDRWRANVKVFLMCFQLNIILMSLPLSFCFISFPVSPLGYLLVYLFFTGVSILLHSSSFLFISLFLLDGILKI